MGICCSSVSKTRREERNANGDQKENEKESTSIQTKTLSMQTFPFNLKFQGASLSKDIRKVYKFKDVLGGGHFGSVRIGYRRDEEPKKYYAIKSICLSSLKEKDLTEMIHEVEIITHLQHPNIIKFYETYYDESYFHIVMELCKGKDVFEKII